MTTEKKQDATANPGEKTPIYKRRWFQIVAGIVALFVIVGACSDSDDTPKSQDTNASQSDSKGNKPSKKEQREQEKAEREAEREAKAKQREEEKAAKEAEDAALSQEANDWFKTQMGLYPTDPWTTMLQHDPIAHKYAYIQDITIGHGSNIVVEAQIDRTTDKDIAEGIATAFAGLVRNSPDKPEWAERASYVIVEDGTGTHVKQVRI